jgi:hypothetical protein
MTVNSGRSSAPIVPASISPLPTPTLRLLDDAP